MGRYYSNICFFLKHFLSFRIVDILPANKLLNVILQLYTLYIQHTVGVRFIFISLILLSCIHNNTFDIFHDFGINE